MKSDRSDILKENCKGRLLQFAVVIPIVLVIFDKQLSDNYDLINNILILETGIAILWYSIETFELKILQRKQLVEQRRSLYLNLRPFIRLEWSQISSYGGNINHGLWHIKIINEGEGVAVNLELKSSNSKKIFNSSLIGGKKEYLPVTEPNYKDFKYTNEVEFLKQFRPNKNYDITISYQDITGLLYTQIFKTDETEPSKYSLVKWNMPRVFEKVNQEMVMIKRK